MTTYYMITTLLSLINLVILIFTFENKKINYYFMICMIIMVIANSGYYSIALATSVQEAVLANKLSYLGGCFMPVIVLFFICAICNYKVSMWIRAITYSFSFFVYGMVLTVGFSDIYYKTVYLEKYGDATVLGHTYGPGHAFFYVILYGTLVVQLSLLIYSIIKKNIIPRLYKYKKNHPSTTYIIGITSIFELINLPNTNALILNNSILVSTQRYLRETAM